MFWYTVLINGRSTGGGGCPAPKFRRILLWVSWADHYNVSWQLSSALSLCPQKFSSRYDHLAWSKVCFGIPRLLSFFGPWTEALQAAVPVATSEGYCSGLLCLIITKLCGRVAPPFLYAHINFHQDPAIELGVKCVLVSCHFFGL